jgi:hypothetical protein
MTATLRANPRTNRYADHCAACGAHVAAQAGTLEGPPWKTYCAVCLPPPARQARPAGPIVKATLRDRTVEFRLVGFAGAQIFGAYREACRPCRAKKVGDQWHNQIPLADAGPVLASMRQVDGLTLEVDAEILDALRMRADDVAQDLGEARERLVEIDQKLAARGQALYQYQRAGIEWLSTQDAAILADDMGLGKSLQGLASAPEDAPILVISPAVAKDVWVREAKKWRPDLTPVLLSGRGSFQWPKPGEMVVINYDILPDVAGEAPRGTVLIADEAHAVKNTKAKRTQRFRAIAKAVREAGGNVWLLTATPLLGKPPELWALLQAIDRVPFSGFNEFAKLMGGVKEYIPRVGEVWQWGGTPSPEVARRLQPMLLRRMKVEVLTDLPPKRYRSIEVELPKSLHHELGKVLKKWDTLSHPNELPPFELMSTARAQLAEAKIPTMLALVDEYEEAGEPLVVMSAHRAPIDTFLSRAGWGVITGDGAFIEGRRVSARGDVEDAFQAGKLKGVAATIQAGGVAITLTHASNAIFVDLDWTPALNAQAEDRIYRIGQTRGVLITRLVGNHALDQRMLEVLSDKQELITASVDAARRDDQSFVGDAGAAELDALAAQLEDDMAELVADLVQVAEAQEEYRRRIIAHLDRAARERAEREIEQKWQGEIKARARRRGVEFTRDVEDEERREAETEVEYWVSSGLQTLAAMDPDWARSKNEVGFNRSDGFVGHMLAGRVGGGGLSNAEWLLAEAMLAKYWRQIGRSP